MTMRKIILLSCVLAAVVMLKIRIDTPQGPQPLARAIMTHHLKQMREEVSLP
jgi:hypothetical protein